MDIQYYYSCDTIDDPLASVIQSSACPKNIEGVNGDNLKVLPCDPPYCRSQIVLWGMWKVVELYTWCHQKQ